MLNTFNCTTNRKDNYKFEMSIRDYQYQPLRRLFILTAYNADTFTAVASALAPAPASTLTDNNNTSNPLA